jgi:uncharacterized phosphosugar-binding protein
MSALDSYFTAVQTQLTEIQSSQRNVLLQAAGWVAKTLQEDGFIYAFGSGHSHGLAEEIFYRAGGLARTIPILDEKLMVHVSASESTAWERKEGYAEIVLARYSIRAGDTVFVISNSGRNPVPIEVALGAKARGAKTIAILSRKHSGNFASRHSSGKKLVDVADLVIDNGSPAGDASIEIPGLTAKMGPTSTLTSAFILHSILAEAAARMAAAGKPVEVYPSINTDSGAMTEALTHKYKGIIPHL